MILAGTDAVSGIKSCTATKARSRAPKRTSSRMTRQLFQVYVDPPHCKARRRQTILGTKKKVPKGSSRVKCCQKVAESC